MDGNSLGKAFKITSFGESHGRCVGVVVDGCPADLKISEKDIQNELDKRRPGQSKITTTRKEEDRIEVLSGIFNGFTTGAPICMLVWNKDVNSSEYEKIRFTPRPGHADYTAYMKYKGFNDYRGGGFFSGRITAGFVIAGAIAKKLLELYSIEVLAHTIQIGSITVKRKITDGEIRANTYSNDVRCADLNIVRRMEKEILRMKNKGDSIGGIVECRVLNLPIGIGEPVFDSVESVISHAMFSIPGIKGVEFGAGFKLGRMMGSEANDQFTVKNGKVVTLTNNSGGVLGGISNGMPLLFGIVVKPTPSISKKQKTVDLKKMKGIEIILKDRHDPCIVPRAVPVVESMAAIVITDLMLRTGLIPRTIQ